VLIGVILKECTNVFKNYTKIIPTSLPPSADYGMEIGVLILPWVALQSRLVGGDRPFPAPVSTAHLPSPLPMFAKENLFALSLFPYLGFLWFLTRTPQTPRLALVGFYMTLVFVAITIPAGLYAQSAYHDELANVDWLHGGAEFFLTLANILVVIGFRVAIHKHQATPPSE